MKTGAFTPSTSTVIYTGNYGSGNTSVVATTYHHLTLNNGSEIYDAAGTVTANGTLTAQAGTFEVGTNTVTGGNVTVSGGTFAMSSGNIVTSDVATAPILTTAGVEGTNFFTVTFTGGTLNVAEWDIRSVDSNGVQIGSGVTLTAFDKITWAGNFQTTGGTADSLLNVVSQSGTLSGHSFPASWTGGECAVRLNTSGALTLDGFTGAFSGDLNDCDSTNGLGGVTGTGVVTWTGGATPPRIPRPPISIGAPSIY